MNPCSDDSVDKVTPSSTTTAQRLKTLLTEVIGTEVSGGERFVDFTDSISALEYVNRVRETFNVDVPTAALFDETPDVDALAALVERQVAATQGAGRVSAPSAVRHPGIMSLPGGGWSVWRTLLLRGAGFATAMLSELSDPDVAPSADAYLVARRRSIEARTTALRQISPLIRAAPDQPSRTALRRARRRLQQQQIPSDVCTPGVLALVEARAQLAMRERELSEVYERAALIEERKISALLENPSFREAALWQNRHAIASVRQELARESTDQGARRNAVIFLAMLAQRYTSKNDSIGFFGPLCWGQFVDDKCFIRSQPGRTLLKHREVYFEGWGIDEIATAISNDVAVRPWCAPRLKAGIFSSADGVFVPVIGHVPLRDDHRRLLELCDGQRSAMEIAVLARNDANFPADSEQAIFDKLQTLADQQIIEWKFEVPSQLHPERELVQRVMRIADEAVRDRWLRPVERLLSARASVARAAGNPTALEDALGRLDDVFMEITRVPATRRSGRMYAGRGLVFEDCQRDCSITLGQDCLDRVGPPLSLFLDSARWVASELRRTLGQQLRTCWSELKARLGTDAIDAHLFVNYVNERGRALLAPLSGQVLSEARRRWRWVLGTPLDERRVMRSVAEIRERAAVAFASAGQSSWGSYFTPDLLIASAGLEAFREGAFECVLGELHSNNTLLWSALTSQHPTPQTIDALLDYQLKHDATLLMHTPKDRWLSRLDVRTLPTFWRYEFGDDAPSVPRCRALPAGRLLATDDGNVVRLTARDDPTISFDAYDLFAVTMSYEVDRIVSAMLAQGPHTPRITIDSLTVMREQWQVTPGEMEFLHQTRPALCFAMCRAWASTRQMPRRVFYKSPGESKPCYLDFESPVFTAAFVKLMKRLRPTAVVRMVEMFPTLDEAWLEDSNGRRYTSEIRIVARPDAP